ncbi:RecQ family ATP-dependent DNA helicase [Desulfobulbus rhabdoformis]|uniref:RecQ family ATP-dependent DNA helicase n=1 Tax=Desulfobulbus rhabdoformis TaxID=34032 RepID=UPI0019660C16|nr:RecQ family ATP-dependent DNA helicase [Desulfobulbus rhabdoformis]MBM9612974.1 RecQ family ATP-dependent DNA helicase [Desulfobulbus rhabdoformis]
MLDIEVNEKNEIYSLGAVYQDQRFLWKGKGRIEQVLIQEFETFSRDASFVLGHNILVHDLPRLERAVPGLSLFARPGVDTLFLSPLAFPANPYHRLVKNYQLVRDSINNPVQDALLAGEVFGEQWQALIRLLADNADLVRLYHGMLALDGRFPGLVQALAAMNIPLLTGSDLLETFARFARRYACSKAVDQLAAQVLERTVSGASLAYVVAWLSVADGNSVLPSWVRHQHPQVSELLHQLRENNCGDAACGYCHSHHDPLQFLERYYGFPSFRSEPATVEGKSLQAEIVGAAAQGGSLFATLPTGGGKSLCYLLPALMRYLRRNMLTIVISPLQALMKDQVDNFARLTGTKIAAALYGLLTMPERAEVLEGIRLGDIGIVLVSPEQLRNASFRATISQREVGAWVFDEAHCLSKWGHDFRPDYLYAIRFIQEFSEQEHVPIPPVQCFTATAKKDVRAEIVDIIQSQLGLRMQLFAGGHDRTNLHYEVWAVERYEKYQSVLELLRARFEDEGSVVIYCATRRNTELLAEFLQENGWNAEAFHAGLEPSLKKRIQDNFVSNVTPIICATNAFGMGIDKEDVRLVIHLDIPGSLENYLQEAGRAGRDRREAECVLIFNEQDIEGQFRLSAGSMLNQRQIAQFLRGIRYAARGTGSVVLTAGELLRQDVVEIEADMYDGDTRVRTALAWLERAGYLRRNGNKTQVFQGKPTHRNLEEAKEALAKLDLSARRQDQWLAILEALMERGRPNQSFSADELAGLQAFAPMDEEGDTVSATQRVIRTLHDMATVGMLEQKMLLSAYVRYKVAKSSKQQLQQVVEMEQAFLAKLGELAPDIEAQDHVQLDLRAVNQLMIDEGFSDSSPQILKLFLYGLSRDGKGLAGARGSLSFRASGNNRFTIFLHRDWSILIKTVKLRQLVALRTLQTIIDAIPAEINSGANLLVEFSLEQIISALRGDLLLADKLKDPLAAAERALMFLHEQSVINLQQGLAVFRQAMTIELDESAKGRRYSKQDFLPLKTHYDERTFQIHVMNEYAHLALDKLSSAWQYVASYFEDDKDQFLKRFFAGKEKFFERATSKQSYQRIVEDLANAAQEKIVTADPEKNLLVLAGPGSGKTRVVAHRVAYLLRVVRVAPRAILVLCFNRSAIQSLRQRLFDLVGEDMAGVTLLTFHGLALRLTGQSLVTKKQQGKSEEVDFSTLILDAIALLKGEKTVLGLEEVPADFALIGRFSHILVDEYQDIDADQYELVSLVAGKGCKEREEKMAILAVGDDDQNIYRFRGASVAFIRRFQEDYDAELHYLMENYRSTDHIIQASNQLIGHNQDRMKNGHPIRLNSARASLPPGGNWQRLDSLAQGRVQILEVEDTLKQSLALLQELERLQGCGSIDLGRCAVLAREWKDLEQVRCLCEQNGIPVRLCWGRQQGFPRLTRIRENADLLAWLRPQRAQALTVTSVEAWVHEQFPRSTIWSKNLCQVLQRFQEETGTAAQPVSAIEDYLYEILAEQGRGKSLGEGLLLATAHAVKGLEFDHVFILGENWREATAHELEEERRLYYVSMSRARESLHLFSLAHRVHPHVALLAGDWIKRRTVLPGEERSQQVRFYHLLGLEDVFLDYAGLKPEGHQSRQALEQLVAGDRVELRLAQGAVEIYDKHQVVCGRLSKKAQAEWEPNMSRIREVRVVVLVRRYREDLLDKAFAASCKGEAWLVPIIEIILNP